MGSDEKEKEDDRIDRKVEERSEGSGWKAMRRVEDGQEG